MVERLTPIAERMAHRQIIVPVIIRSKPRRIRELYYEIKQYLPHVLPATLREIMPYHIFRTRLIERFDMLSTILPREIIFDLAEHPLVERIYYDAPIFISQYPVVPREGVYEIPRGFRRRITFTTTYWTKKIIGAERANELGFTGRGIKVAILDTGVNRFHEQLRGRVYTYSVMHYTMDDNGHGTWVTSCIGGARGIDDHASRITRTNIICEGIAPDAILYSIKCLGYVIGMGSTSGIIDALNMAIDLDIDIVNMSLGGKAEAKRPEDDPFKPVFEELLKNNIIPCVAAGNEGPEKGTISTPGVLEEALTVGAYNPIKGEIARFSSRGPTPWGSIKPDCIAPGVNIDSATVMVCDMAGDNFPNRYSPISGTSMATPHVAGLVALMRQAYYEILGKVLTIDEIKRMLSKLGHEKNNDDGWGIIDWPLFEEWMETEYGLKI